MGYVLTLDEPSSKKLEALAGMERLPATKLIERVVRSYLDSIGKASDFSIGEGVDPDLNVARLKEIYKWDEENGAILTASSKKRVFVMNAHSWDAVERYLFLNLLTGAEVLLSEMGNAYGRGIALDYRSVTEDPENLGSYFENLGLAAGWGRFTLSGDLHNGSKITVKVRDCVFCRDRNASLGRGDKCSFLMGVCKGIADTVFDFPHFVYETKCCAKGNDYCQIVMTREADSESGKVEFGRVHALPSKSDVAGASWFREISSGLKFLQPR